MSSSNCYSLNGADYLGMHAVCTEQLLPVTLRVSQIESESKQNEMMCREFDGKKICANGDTEINVLKNIIDTHISQV